MNLALDNTNSTSVVGSITISGSKSESNRLLILQELFPNISIENLSNSDDSIYLKKALQTNSETIDIGHSGTAMRFLTAFFSIQKGKSIQLTGSSRMQERPIKILVDALRELGASISYLRNNGFPPLQIVGKELIKDKLVIKANTSSQYISALLLIAPTLPNGLELQLEGKTTSVPYIKMTLSLLAKIGIETSFKGNSIKVSKPKIFDLSPKTLVVEPDWSSASYFFSLVALQQNSSVELVGFKKDSLQGDSVLPEIYKQLGVSTNFTNNGIIIQSIPKYKIQNLKLDLCNTPDLAQTIAVTCLGLGINCQLTGLHTLKIKETDRLEALKNELEKMGATVAITKDSLNLTSPKQLKRNCSIRTYEDHRMAMSFAPLSVKVPLEIENSGVVSKSYPLFWNDFESVFTKY